MTGAAVDSLDQVPAIEWDRLAAGRSFYLSHAWLRSLEDDRQARARYLMVWSGSRLAGALPVYRVTREPNPFYDPDRLADGRWSGEPYILAGSRRAYVNDLLLDGDLFACRRGAGLVAFCLTYPWGACLHERMLGFDYAALANAYEYFNMVFYVPLAYAYAHGLRKVHLGRESYPAKVLRGARLSPLWSLELDHDRPSQRWNRRLAERWRQELRGHGEAFVDRGWELWGC